MTKKKKATKKKATKKKAKKKATKKKATKKKATKKKATKKKATKKKATKKKATKKKATKKKATKKKAKKKKGKGKDLNDYVRRLDEVGWLEGHPDRDSYFAAMERRFAEGVRRMSSTLPWVWFDAECVYEEGEYAGLINELAEASCGWFAPTRVRETWSGKGRNQIITLEVRVAGNSHTIQFPYESDYFHSDFYEYVDDVVAASRPGLSVYWKDTGGQDGLVIVAPKSAVAPARSARLL